MRLYMSLACLVLRRGVAAYRGYMLGHWRNMLPLECSTTFTSTQLTIKHIGRIATLEARATEPQDAPTVTRQPAVIHNLLLSYMRVKSYGRDPTANTAFSCNFAVDCDLHFIYLLMSRCYDYVKPVLYYILVILKKMLPTRRARGQPRTKTIPTHHLSLKAQTQALLIKALLLLCQNAMKADVRWQRTNLMVPGTGEGKEASIQASENASMAIEFATVIMDKRMIPAAEASRE
ncbi:hypothetical protein Tco_0549606 [Tanacetum coccineum]